MKTRFLVRLYALLLNPILNIAEVRRTVQVCIAAVCDYGAISLVNFLFSHHLVAFWTLTLLLHAGLIVFAIKYIFREAFEGEHGNRILRRLSAALNVEPQDDEDGPVALKPKGDTPETSQPARATNKPAQRKTVTVKTRKAPARKPRAKAEPVAPDPAAPLPENTQPDAAPKRPRRRKLTQALES